MSGTLEKLGDLKLLEEVFDQLDLYTMIVDETFNILKVNEKMKEFGDLARKTCCEVFHGQRSPPKDCAILHLLEGKKGKVEFYASNLNKWFRSNANKIKVGDSFFFLIFLEDITEKKELEEALKKDEEKYRIIFEQSKDAVVLLSHEGKYIDINKAGMELFGYSKEEIRELDPRELYGHLDAHRDFLQKLMEEGSVKDYELQFRKSDGTLMNCLIAATIWQDEGEIRGYQAIIRDISDVYQMNEAFKERQERFRLFSYASFEGIVIHNNHEIVDANETCAKMLGYNLSEIIGMNIFDLIDREYHNIALRNIHAELENRYEIVSIKKDGSPITVEVCGKIINYKGRPAQAMAIHDISERKEFEEALKKSEVLHRAIIDTANSLIIGLDGEGRFKLFNKKCEEITGRKREEVIEKDWLDILIPKKEKTKVQETFEKIKAGELSEWRNLVKTKDGEKLIWWQKTSIRDGKEEIFIGIGIDITEQEASRKKVEELNEILKLVNKIIRHDIRNDLCAISLALEVFKDSKDEKLLDTAFKAIDRSSTLLGRMKELESVVSPSDNLKRVSLRKTIGDIINNYSVEYEIENDCMVLIDDAFVSAIDNIIRNAVAHGKTDKIDVKIEAIGTSCKIRIADYGPGIPDEIKKKIFQEGFKYGSTGGTGIGLYIVKKVIEKYGGEIFVEDNKPTGSVFVLKLNIINGINGGR